MSSFSPFLEMVAGQDKKTAPDLLSWIGVCSFDFIFNKSKLIMN